MLNRNWGKIPVELKRRNQWVYTEKGSKIPKSGFKAASVTDPASWVSFAEACEKAKLCGGEIGYVLSEGDPFTCIDLDVKDEVTHPGEKGMWTTQKDFDRYWAICQYLNSYTEKSVSGKGLHIWVKGKIGKGCRRDGVELYSQERFIICTGDVVIACEIKEHQTVLDKMVKDIRGVDEAVAWEDSEEWEDWEIVERGEGAENGQKFIGLCSGAWQEMGYESQSEADFALMSILAFYSKSNTQCKRLFRYSGLGKRDKASREKYLNDTLAKIRRQQVYEHSSIVNIDDELGRAKREKAEREKILLHVPGVEVKKGIAPAVSVVAGLAPEKEVPGLPWPPGLCGAIAQYIYGIAPRPVKEVAIISAIGLLAGICGKAFSIPQSGLNLYLVLVAKSAVGKEAMHSGISALMSAITLRQPAAIRFVDFSDFASGPALRKAVAMNPSFLNVAGEWGHKLKRFAEEKEAGMMQLRQVMTDLYQKSGPASIMGGISYSNKDQNVASIAGAAYSMVGESTPGRFYESLTDSMMEDGFMSRFLIIEYAGQRPPLNINPITEPPKALGDALAELCTHAMTLIDRHEHTAVVRTNEAAGVMEGFEEECDREINQTDDEMWRQMWNRASLKMMRLAGLLAVGDNWINPLIEKEHVEWAMLVVRKDIDMMGRRIESGDIGTTDFAREMKVVSELAKIVDNGGNNGIRDVMLNEGIIPRRSILMRIRQINAFTKYHGGVQAALDHTLRSMCDNGYIVEIDKFTLMDKYSFRGKAYKIVDLPNYKKERTL